MQGACARLYVACPALLHFSILSLPNFCVALCIFLCCSVFFVLFNVFFVLFCVFRVVICIFCVVLCIFMLFYVFFCVVLCIFVLFYVCLCCSVYFCVVLCIVSFVTYSVLFVCVCVLYYCHRVATQLQLNISYQTADKKRILNTICVIRFSLQLQSETFPILRRTERDMIQNVCCYSCNVTVFRVRF
jgi:hypothetical protein